MCLIFCCSIIQGGWFQLPSEKCEISSLGRGLELPGLVFYDKVSVSKFEPGLGGYGLDYTIGSYNLWTLPNHKSRLRV